ncbi:nucleotide sugar dehydrogenase [Candidatus Babeliales bacterium]|nr:nucleotide sugar dehydrogenase [Candidatus Babeliales bacterium]
MSKISVVGLGYIGLPTAIIASEHGFEVFGYDTDKNKVRNIKKGNPVIFEPEISTRLEQALTSKKLKISGRLEKADCFIITVPTPFKEDPKTKKAELSYVFSAGKAISKVLEPGNLIILESTVPAGTTNKLTALIEAETGLRQSRDFFVAYCPERVLPGRIFNELVTNDRVIGGICPASSKKVEAVYAFVQGKIHVTDAKTAEMVKLVENSSRDVQIAFANQVASMCAEEKVNPFEVIEIANKHPRVNILNPGCGVGGHCIAVDPWFLVERFPKNSALLRVTRKINDSKPVEIVDQVVSYAKNFTIIHKRKPKVLVLGLTFKANVDDLRNSPAVSITQMLKKVKEVNCNVCEPHVELRQLKALGFTKSVQLDKGLKDSDLILILVGHRKFASINFEDFKDKLIIDACGLTYKPKFVEAPKSFKAARLTKDDMQIEDQDLSDVLLSR